MLASIYVGRYPEKIGKAVLAEPGYLDHETMEIWNDRTGLAGMKPSFPVVIAMTEAWAVSLHIKGPDEQARRDYLMERFMTTLVEDHPLGGFYPQDDITNAAGESWKFGSLAGRSVQASGLDDEGRLLDR